MVHSALTLAVFALSVAAFSITLVAGLLVAIRGNPIGLPFCFQTLTFCTLIFLPNLTNLVSPGQSWFGGGGYQALFLGAYALNLWALGLYVHALVERPFRGWSRALTLGTSLVGLSGALFELVCRVLKQANLGRFFWETWDLSVIALVEVVLVFCILAFRWRHIRSRLRRRLAGCFGLCALVGFGLSVVNLNFLGFNTVSPVSLENLCLLVYCIGNSGLLVPEALAGFSKARGPLLQPEIDLTDREQQLVRLLNEGLSNKEAAFQLGISGSTVKNHLYHVYKKLGVRSRVELLNRVLLK